MIKLIVSDMDGTLLDDNKNLPQGIEKVILKLRNCGVRFAIASGRQYQSLVDKFQSLANDLIFIAENGMYVVDGGKELLCHQIPLEAVKEFILQCRKIPHTNVLISGKDTAYMESDDSIFLKAVESYYANTKIVDDLTTIKEDILKISIHNDLGTKDHVYPHFQVYGNQFLVCVSAREWLDITLKDIHKGRAVKEIQELYNIDYKETMIFGDFMNDYEMMQEGYYSYAMKNAIPEIKEISNFVTAYTNNEQGVLKELKKHFSNI